MHERRIGGRRRLAQHAVGIGAVILLAAGCGGGATAMPAQEAVAHHELVVEEILAAADTVRPLTWQRSSQQIIEPGAEDCRYQPGVWEADAPLYPEPGQGMAWEPWREALDPVLGQHGFDALSREQSSGGDLWLEAEGPHGSRVLVHAEGTLRLTDVLVDADPCEDATLGL